MSTNGSNGDDGSEWPKDPGKTLETDSDRPKPASHLREAEDTRPSVEDLVGADMPFEPLPPPMESKHWDRVKGRWVRDGVSIPPDPTIATLPPQPIDTASSAPGRSTPAANAKVVVPDDLDAPVPRWALVIVALMFGIGLGVGLLFTLAH